jgi:membrane fusion protein (multidrug efflux system)
MADGDRIALREARSPDLPRESTATRPKAPPVSRRKRVRWLLLILGPVLVIAAGLYLYLTGGRYVTTDNAFVQADKVTIGTDVAGTVAEVAVRNNQPVTAGQLLFRLNDEPYRIALAGAEAQLASVRNDIAALQASYREKLAEIQQAQADVEFFDREFKRQQNLASRQVASQVAFDQARHNLQTAQQKITALRQQAQGILAQLGGDPDQPVEKQARYLQAQAQVDKARRDLRRTTVEAPMAGIVTNVDALQIGEYLPAGQAAFSLVAADHVWVEANPKETDLTYVKPGDAATVSVDTYPGREWTATVASVSPATGAEFSLLPPQNASGNWVKVVQRIPVRLKVEVPANAPPLRAGMSAEISIDTGHKRTLGDLVESARRWIGA